MLFVQMKRMLRIDTVAANAAKPSRGQWENQTDKSTGRCDRCDDDVQNAVYRMRCSGNERCRPTVAVAVGSGSPTEPLEKTIWSPIKEKNAASSSATLSSLELVWFV
ncbi:uncharacterized protein MEPE_04785 [Melanopsichium pennsylvanicum]|uniref:Uncharacterized protein n=1 Tax=Melanopsichium pennsylvanicum TaxID=63383 RepID=A0AAJ4XQG7_9BASI|nr:uncharacterized protein MEPE_04785 [Melanopsichium pennsylvanicum]